jgi:hypothetical protein
MLQRRPEEKLDNGVIIYTYVEADLEEEAKIMAENKVREDFFVDKYKFVEIRSNESWMAETMAKSADSMLMQEFPLV